MYLQIVIRHSTLPGVASSRLMDGQPEGRS